MLAEELAQLNAEIEQARQKHEVLEGELRIVAAELETFSADTQRFAALRDVCNALDKLGELKADELFWEGVAEAQKVAGHVERAKSRVARFDGEISGILEKQATLQEQINRSLDELDVLDEEVRNAYDRDERRKEEYVIEREISPVPYRPMIMPWSKEAESERRFRRAVLVALFICFVLSSTISLIKVPVLDRLAVVVVPERLVSLLKKEPPKPAPVRKPVPKGAQEEPKYAKNEPKPRPDQHEPELPASGGGASAAREKAEGAGLLKFKEAFAGLMNEIPVPKLGTEARLSNESPRVAGQAVAQRSLVAMQADGGSSGGIGNAGISRNIGSGGGGGGGAGAGIGSGIGSGKGPGFARVESSIAGPGGGGPRPLSDGPAPGRTDEEIQIVFDRYKASLYRIYNAELRKDPTLRGKMLLRITIETSGEVSMCRVESTDLASPELVANIVERIKKFNFGPKEGVLKLTILYPIDFLPAA